MGGVRGCFLSSGVRGSYWWGWFSVVGFLLVRFDGLFFSRVHCQG